MTANIRWGILGTASIAMRRLVPAIQLSQHGEIVAIASRELPKAEAAAREASIPSAHGSYQALIDDPDVDAIYIPLPNNLHLPWTLRALEAGKHVLCEKPLGLSANEARGIMQAAQRQPHLKVMEAFMYRFHPRWEAIRALIQEGGIGALGTVHTLFCYDNTNPADIRNQSGTGGGALLDIGCYGISVARWLFGHEPVHVRGARQLDPRFGIDRLTSGVLDFGNGTATFTCGTQLPWQQQVTIVGATGRIEVDRPFNPHGDRASSYRIVRGDQEPVEVHFPACDQYTIMVDRFQDAIRNDTPVPTPLEDAMANMTVIDGLASGAKGRHG
jgi:predicted dehydrogenase